MSTSRSEAKEQSRQRLVHAAVMVLSEEGIGRLTTGRIARHAGLSQPSFYVHFRDMDDLLDSVAAEVVAPLRRLLAELPLSARVAHDVVRTAWAAVLDALLAEPAAAKVLLAYRRDRATPLGRAIGRVQEEVQAAVEGTLAALVPEAGERRRKVQAELVLALGLGALEALLEGRVSRDDCLEGLALTSTATLAALRRPES